MACLCTETVPSQTPLPVCREALFDDYGRRVPYEGMRVFNQVSRRYNSLQQPDLNYPRILARLKEHLGVKAGAPEFEAACTGILSSLADDCRMKRLLKGVRVPFICPPRRPETSRAAEVYSYVAAAGRAYRAMFPEFDFQDLSKGKAAGDVHYAPACRYEKFDEARCSGAVVGWYFPNCLSEYDLASQRAQIKTLPFEDTCVLSGIVDAAAAIIGSPDLLRNDEAYPHHLCLSAVVDEDDRFFYTFEAYDPDLWFNRRSQMLAPGVTQVSEAWAGGLTVFRPFSSI